MDCDYRSNNLKSLRGAHMKKVSKSLIIFLILTFLMTSFNVPALMAASPALTNQTVEKTYLIKFKDTEQGKKETIFTNKKIAVYKNLPFIASKLNATELQQLSTNPNIEYIEPDRSIHITSESFDDNQIQIGMEQATEHEQYGKGAKVAVLDTGIDQKSPELHIIGGISFVSDETSYDDVNGHGTHIAGTIAALKDNQGLIGVAPEASVYAVKVLDKTGEGTYSQVLQGIDWAIDNKMDIVSMSFSGKEYSIALAEAMDEAYQKGILLVAAAGNDGGDTVDFPARLHSVMAVGAVDGNNEKAPFSNTGNEVELVAPGVNIQGLALNHTYSTISGTSVSVPYVVGVAALVKGQNPALSNQQIRSILNESATPLGETSSYGHGLINASAALDLSKQRLPLPKQPLNGEKSKTNQLREMLAAGEPQEIKEVAADYSVSEEALQELLNQGYTLSDIDKALNTQKTSKKSLQASLDRVKPKAINNSQNSKSKINSELPKAEFLQLRSPEDFANKMMVAQTAPPPPIDYVKLSQDQAPYSVKLDQETISTLTGSLSTGETDVVLPGRNGLSFALTRTYDSSASQFFDMGVYYQQYSNNVYSYYVNAPVTYATDKMRYYAHQDIRKWAEGVKCSNPSINQGWVDLGIVSSGDSSAYSTYSAAQTKANEFSQYRVNYSWGVCQSDVKWRNVEIGTGSVRSESYRSSTSSGSNTYGPYSSYSDASSAKQTIDSNQGALVSDSGWSGSDSSGYARTFAYISGNASIQSVVSGTETYYVPYNNTMNAYEDSYFPIGKGWRWDIPYLQVKDGKQYLHLAGGGSYEISGSTLKGYPWKDLVFTTDTSVSVNGETSYYLLKSVQGIKQYFNSEGRLIQIADANGNTIQFKYTYNSNYGKVLSSVVDAIGNTINITYSPTNVVITSGNKTVTYNKTTQNGKELLTQVTDPQGRKTTYDYSLLSAKFNLLGTSPVTDNPYALLSGITHPTGAKTVYQYESVPVNRYVGSNMVNQAFRVSSRENQIRYADNSVGVFNKKTLSYSGDVGSSYAASFSFNTTIQDGLTHNKFTHKKTYIDDNTPAAYYNTNVTATAGTSQQITNYTYDEARRLPVPNTTTSYFKNTQNGAQSQTTTVSRSYDDYGNVLTETNPLNITTVYGYDPTTRLLVSESQPLSTTKTQYNEYIRNAQGKVKQLNVKSTNATGTLLQQINYDYDAYGNVTATRMKDGNREIVSRTEYSSVYQSAFPTKVTQDVADVDGAISTITVQGEYDLTTGQLTKYIDGKLYATSYQYDKLGRVLKATHTDQSSITNTYDDVNNQITTTNETGMKTITKWNPLGMKTEAGIEESGTYKAKIKQGYDTYGRVAWSEDAVGKRTQFTYDAWSRPAVTLFADSSSSSSQYDDINLIQTTIDPEGVTLRSTLDKLGRVWKKEEVKPTGTTILETLTYDYVGNVLQRQDAKNYITTFEYDFLSQLTSVTNPKNEKTQYSYNALGKLTQLVYPDTNKIQKQYDDLGRLIKQTDALNQITKFYYDANSNRTKLVDRKGQNFTYEYSNRNNLTKKIGPSETITFEFNTDGSRKKMIDNTGTTTYSYKPFTGELQSVTYPDGKTIQYTYDVRGNRDSMVDPFNNTLRYQYDALNRLQNVSTSAGANEFDASYTYYKNGAIKDVSQGNGMVSSYTYDGIKLKTLTHKKSDNSIVNTYSYNYDVNNNIVGKTENVSTFNFTYDPLNRIETSSQFSESYTYDSRGNRQTLQSTQIPDLSQAQYEYDEWDRLSKVTTLDGKVVTYKYNGDNLLYERTESGETTRYYNDGSSIIAEGTVSNGTVTPKVRYTRGIGLVNRIDSSGNKAYYLTNGHGDVVELRDNTGAVLNQYSYDIWGNSIAETEGVPNLFRYSGEFWDATSSLQYLRARWYDPSIGRFINEDTSEGQITNPLSLNLYTYVQNNPLIYTDPSGNIPVKDFGSGLYDTIAGGTKSAMNGLKKTVNNAWGGLKNWWFGDTPEVIEAREKAEIKFALMQDDTLGMLTTQRVGPAALTETVLRMIKEAVVLGEERNAINKLASSGMIDPSKVRFTQNSIKAKFKDESDVSLMINGLKTGKIKADDIPAIRIYEFDGKLYSLDNRRLYAFQQAGIDVKYIFASQQEFKKEILYKFTTTNDGLSIKVRGGIE